MFYSKVPTFSFRAAFKLLLVSFQACPSLEDDDDDKNDWSDNAANVHDDIWEALEVSVHDEVYNPLANLSKDWNSLWIDPSNDLNRQNVSRPV